jgi:hypothetical protein
VPFYRGWRVVLACGIIASFSWGLGFYGLGVYLHALSRRHGWSAGLISVAVTVYYALSAGCIVAVGGLTKRSQRGSDFDRLIALCRDGHARTDTALMVRPARHHRTGAQLLHLRGHARGR